MEGGFSCVLGERALIRDLVLEQRGSWGDLCLQTWGVPVDPGKVVWEVIWIGDAWNVVGT
jgi:hypothetical protein